MNPFAFVITAGPTCGFMSPLEPIPMYTSANQPLFSVTGGLIAKHLSANAPNIKWAVSGRSEEKLSKLIDSLSAVPDINKPDTLVLDVLNDPESKLRSVLDDTRVVIDVVGPYSYWGEKVLKPCVDAGTAWVDLNGEVPW